MMERILPFAVFWGVWILIPILVDGLDTLYHLGVVFLFRRRTRRCAHDEDALPRISVVIPAHNEELTVDRCLNSLKVQDYPHERLEVIVIDDGSTDATSEAVAEHVNGNVNGNGRNGGGVRVNGTFIPVGDFSGVVKLVSKEKSGKADALNTGIAVAHGEIIVNIDCDVVLAPHTLRRTAEAFMRDPRLAAATGNIQVSWDIVEERDKSGDIVLDADGRPVVRELGGWERFLARCQFLEYLHAFWLGREAQDVTQSIYTLSGAFSAFRREVLLESIHYRSLTVSEDTDLTFDLHGRHGRVGFIPEAIVFMEPMLTWDDLYAQRVRWHRGELECCAAHAELIGNRRHGAFGRFVLPKMLIVDHSLAFPRLVWMFLLPHLGMFGYSTTVVLTACAVMYAFYVFIEAVGIAAVLALVRDAPTRGEVLASLPMALVLPVYRFGLFFARMSGFLRALLEPPEWTVAGPSVDLRRGAANVAAALIAGFGWIGGALNGVAAVAVTVAGWGPALARLRGAAVRLGALLLLWLVFAYGVIAMGVALGAGK